MEETNTIKLRRFCYLRPRFGLRRLFFAPTRIYIFGEPSPFFHIKLFELILEPSSDSFARPGHMDEDTPEDDDHFDDPETDDVEQEGYDRDDEQFGIIRRFNSSAHHRK